MADAGWGGDGDRRSRRRHGAVGGGRPRQRGPSARQAAAVEGGEGEFGARARQYHAGLRRHPGRWCRGGRAATARLCHRGGPGRERVGSMPSATGRRGSPIRSPRASAPRAVIRWTSSMSAIISPMRPRVALPTPPRAGLRLQKKRLKNNDSTAVLAALSEALEPATVPDADAPVRACHRYLSNRLDQLDYQGALAQGLAHRLRRDRKRPPLYRATAPQAPRRLVGARQRRGHARLARYPGKRAVVGVLARPEASSVTVPTTTSVWIAPHLAEGVAVVVAEGYHVSMCERSWRSPSQQSRATSGCKVSRTPIKSSSCLAG